MATVDNTGLIAHWKMDEIAGGQIADETGNYPMTVSSGMTQQASVTDGRFDKAVLVNDGQVLTFALPALATWSVLGWVKTLDLDEYAHLLTAQGNQGAFTIKVYEHSGLLYLYKQATSSKVSNVALPLNEWAHYAVTFDGSVLRFYVNAVEGTSFSGTGFTLPAGNYICGAYQASTTVEDIRWIHDQRRVYNRAISLQEVLDHYNEKSPFFVAGSLKEDGIAQQRVVRLYDAESGSLIDEQTTDGNGEYEFSIFQDKAMYVMAIPETGRRPAVHGPVTISER